MNKLIKLSKVQIGIATHILIAFFLLRITVGEGGMVWVEYEMGDWK